MLNVWRVWVVVVVVVVVGSGQWVQAQQTPDDAFPLSDLEREVTGLKIDLLETSALTLRWKQVAFELEQRLFQVRAQELQAEGANWEQWRVDLADELGDLFACGAGYDLAARACHAPAADDVGEDEKVEDPQ